MLVLFLESFDNRDPLFASEKALIQSCIIQISTENFDRIPDLRKKENSLRAHLSQVLSGSKSISPRITELLKTSAFRRIAELVNYPADRWVEAFKSADAHIRVETISKSVSPKKALKKYANEATNVMVLCPAASYPALRYFGQGMLADLIRVLYASALLEAEPVFAKARAPSSAIPIKSSDGVYQLPEVDPNPLSISVDIALPSDTHAVHFLAFLVRDLFFMGVPEDEDCSPLAHEDARSRVDLRAYPVLARVGDPPSLESAAKDLVLAIRAICDRIAALNSLVRLWLLPRRDLWVPAVTVVWKEHPITFVIVDREEPDQEGPRQWHEFPNLEEVFEAWASSVYKEQVVQLPLSNALDPAEVLSTATQISSGYLMPEVEFFAVGLVTDLLSNEVSKALKQKSHPPDREMATD